jgi:hypothetical protein
MEIGINVDSLQKIIKFHEKNYRTENKNSIKSDKYEKLKSKIVEYNFFIQNEIDVSKIIDKNILPYNKYGKFRYLTIQHYNMIKICETNKKSLENIIDISLFDNKKYLILKYKNIDNHENLFISSLINEENKPLFWNLIQTYEYFFKNLLFLSENNIRLLDFSAKNLLYSSEDSCIYMKNFDKCYKNTKISDFYDDYENEESNINEFIKIMDKIEYFGNKHFDLYFAKQIINHKDLFVILNNMDSIIDEYINNLYFLKFFSEKVKKEIVLKWKKNIKNMSIFDKNQNLNQNISYIISSNNWKLYLCLFLKCSHSQTTIWETFSVNSLFLNISISFLKFFDIDDKNSILHKYIQFLLKSLDIETNNDMILNIEIYNIFISYFEKDMIYDNNNDKIDNIYKATIMENITIEKQEGLYNYLLNNIEFF